MRLFLFLSLLLSSLYGQTANDKALLEQISRMVVVGFDASKLDANSTIIKTLQNYPLGGVILFDRDFNNRNKTKNISSPEQLQALTYTLHQHAKKPLLISVDQEGGKVARLKPRDGFLAIPSAQTIAKLGEVEAKRLYEAQAQMLFDMGINTNFAPVVDLAIEPNNKVITKLERSYGTTSTEVSRLAKVMIDAQTKHHILSVVKHFPGHGSSLEDSHHGLVDVSDSWQKEELEPYAALIKDGAVDMIMSAHVFHSHLDSLYPATLSHAINTKLLRDAMKFGGVVISDDLQMKAITDHYNLKTRLTLAINGGVDMILFGNQLTYNDPIEIIETIYQQVKAGKIPLSRIKEANQRIANLFTHLSIHQRAIQFSEKRVELTKEYIKEHYGFDTESVQITPKSIVLHWTAVMNFEDCFKRFDDEILFSDRQDIANAGALNVSAHFLVARDGTITQLMPQTTMARHTIGLNYSSIGIENVGGEKNNKEDLTPAQVKANIALVKYLKAKYPSIEYLLGHHEYLAMQETALWLELDKEYRTKKSDPGAKFMNEVRKELGDLKLIYPKEDVWKK
ncbi:MAG: glycoside hydrolase family 3 N-terminal domain-containing protein [Sulfurimonadaceae bacterium]|jgi:beta-N-acetylhexosaminidase|nr:glycoside hydrolase family 3 N-terminal domain-containing protein [Sulfurimonadaceae bacterium]